MDESGKSVQGVLDDTKGLLAREDELRKKLRLLSICVPLVIILVFVIYSWMFYSKVKNIETDKFIAVLQDRSVKVWPKLSEELLRIGEKVYPVYAHELDKALSRPVPELTDKMDKEIAALQTSVDEQLTGKLNESLKKIEKKQEKFLEEQVPDIKGDPAKKQAVLALSQSASRMWIKARVDKAFARHIAVFRDLKITLDRSFKTKDSKPPETEEVLHTWLLLMNEKFELEGENIIKPAKAGKK